MLLEDNFYFRCIVLPACKNCTVCTPDTCRSQERVLDSMRLKLRMVASHQVGARKQTWVLKELLSHLSPAWW